MLLTIAIIISGCVGILIIALLAASFHFCNVAILRPPEGITENDPAILPAPNTAASHYDLEWVKAHFQRIGPLDFDRHMPGTLETLEIQTDDGLTLYGYYLPAQTPTNKVAIIAHGYTSRAIPDMSPYAQFYHDELGYNVFMPDNRAHGESEGRYIGFGWLDRLDYLKWIQRILRKVGDDAQIVLHGVSMGGATVLMVSGELLPPQVKAIVSDCAYTSARDILAYQCRQGYRVPPYPLIYVTSLLCKLRAGYFFGEASALAQVRKAQVPILFIHGEEDLYVPTRMVHPLYEQCGSSYKELLLIPQAAHALAYATDKTTYEQRVKQFIERFIKD